MQMPGRTYSSNSYRYGFNGKENDNEIKGEANQQDYGMRIYDPRVGKFLSIDPLIKKYPWYTPYQFAGNKPIKFIDIDGAEEGERSPFEELEYREELEREAREQREREELARILKVPSPEVEKERLNRAEEWLRLPPEERVQSNNRVLRSINRYVNNGLNAAQQVFAPTPDKSVPQAPYMEALMKTNKANGKLWEISVNNYLQKNPNFVRIVNQVTLVVNGTMNGKAVSARIRVDNVALSTDGTVSLYEAKYSFDEITVNGIRQTMTENQKTAFDILINGENVSINIRGNSKPQELGFVNGQNIAGKITSVNVVTPAGTASQNSNQNNQVKPNSNP